MGLSSSCVHQTTAVIPAELATEYSHHTEEFKIRRTKTFLPSSKDTFKVTKRFAKNAKKALKQIQKGVRLPDTSRKVPSTTAATTSLGVCEVGSTTGEFLEINSLDPNYYVGWEVGGMNYDFVCLELQFTRVSFFRFT